ncbi:MAG: hypothetical protein ABEJ79_06500 [Halolamina sp.]
MVPTDARVAVGAVVALVLTTTVASGAVAGAATATTATATTAVPPPTADELLTRLQSFEEEPALSEYSELEVMRSQAVSTVQVGNASLAERRRIAGIVTVLSEFVEAYELAAAGDRIESLEAANETQTAIDSVREAGGDQYARLAQVALERFYRDQGDELYQRGQESTNTTAKLELYGAAREAYEAGGADRRLAEITVVSQELRAEFAVDSRRLSGALANASAFVADCGDGCDGPLAALAALGPNVFAAYTDARRAHAAARQAQRLSDKHGLTARSERAATLVDESGTALGSFAVASVLLALGYGGAVALVGAVVSHRLATWALEVEGARVGRIVPQATVEVEPEVTES